MSEKVTSPVLEEMNMHAETTGKKPLFSALPIELLGDMSVDLQVVIGELTLSVAELMKLKAGDVLPMTKEHLAPVELLLNGSPVAVGTLVVADDHFAVRVESGIGEHIGSH